MSQSTKSTNLGLISLLPPELRFMIYDNLIPSTLNINILSPCYNAQKQPLASPLDNLASTNKTFLTEIKTWYAHAQKAKGRYPELSRNLSLGLGIHNPSSITYFVDFEDFLVGSNDHDNNAGIIDDGTLTKFRNRLQEFSKTKDVPAEVKQLTIFPHLRSTAINQTSENSEQSYQTLQFALFKRILTTLEKIMYVRVQFTPPPNTPDANTTLVNAIKTWNFATHYRLDGRGEDFDQEIVVEMFVLAGSKDGVVEVEELPFYYDPEITDEVDREDLLGRQLVGIEEVEEEGRLMELRDAEGRVDGVVVGV